MICADLPRPAWGASVRNYHLLKALAREHSVALLSLADNVEMGRDDGIGALNDLASPVQVIPCPPMHSKRWQQLKSIARGRSYLSQLFVLAEMQQALNALLENSHYDAVLFESALVAGYVLPSGMKVIIDQHNIEHELVQRTYEYEKPSLRKWYNWQEARLLRSVELERCRRAAIVLVASDRERLVLGDLLPESVIEVVPNGVDVELFASPDTQQEVANQIIFTGTMDYYPNIDAVLSFARRCWPRISTAVPGATWLIVGRNPPPEIRKLSELPGVTVTGTVSDVRSYLATSSVALAPLQIGGGTRIKILEAFAMGKAIVSTSIGCEGLAVVPGKHLAVADTPAAFADAVITLLQNPERRVALGAAGRTLVESAYSWQSCGDHLLRALEEKETIC